MDDEGLSTRPSNYTVASWKDGTSGVFNGTPIPDSAGNTWSNVGDCRGIQLGWSGLSGNPRLANQPCGKSTTRGPRPSANHPNRESTFNSHSLSEECCYNVDGGQRAKSRSRGPVVTGLVELVDERIWRANMRLKSMVCVVDCSS